jgi:arsenate reductase
LHGRPPHGSDIGKQVKPDRGKPVKRTQHGAVKQKRDDKVKAVIWHNPRCSKSRETLAILEATPGIEVEIVEYLKTPPTRAKLAALYARSGITPREGARLGEDAAKTLGLATASDDAILDAMAAHPILIERPLVETEKGVRLGRPPEKVREIL